jgi:hypothetical protein
MRGVAAHAHQYADDGIRLYAEIPNPGAMALATHRRKAQGLWPDISANSDPSPKEGRRRRDPQATRPATIRTPAPDRVLTTVTKDGP